MTDNLNNNNLPQLDDYEVIDDLEYDDQLIKEPNNANDAKKE